MLLKWKYCTYHLHNVGDVSLILKKTFAASKNVILTCASNEFKGWYRVFVIVFQFGKKSVFLYYYEFIISFKYYIVRFWLDYLIRI